MQIKYVITFRWHSCSGTLSSQHLFVCFKVFIGKPWKKKVNILKRSYNLSAVILPWIGKERQTLVNQRIVAFKNDSITLKFNLLVSFFRSIPLCIQFLCHLLQQEAKWFKRKLFAVSTEIFWTKNLMACTNMGVKITHYLSGILSHLIWEFCVFESRARKNHAYWMLKCLVRCTWYFKGIWDWDLMLLYRKPGKNS